MNEDGVDVVTERGGEDRTERRQRSSDTYLVWIVAATILCGLLMLAATVLPPRFRLLGLTAGVLGACVGAIVSQTSGLAGHPAVRIQTWIAVNHAVLVLLGTVAIEYREVLSQLPESGESSVAEAFARTLAADGASSNDPRARAHFQALQDRLEERQSFPRSRFTFARYLQFRLSGLGNVPGALACGLFGAEVGLSAALAAFVVRWLDQDVVSRNSADASNSE